MLYLSGVIIAFFLAVLLISKKKKTAGDHILGAWLLFLGFHLLTFYMKFTGQETAFPVIVTLGVPLPLIHGPFLYLYTYQQTAERPFNKWMLIHFVPVLMSYFLFYRFYQMTHAEQVAVWTSQGKGFETALLINLYAIYISGIIYITLSLFRLFTYRRRIVQQFSNTEKINFNWLLYLIGWIILIWIVILVWQEDELIFGAASLFIVWLGYFGIRQVQVFTHSVTKSPIQPNAIPLNTPGQHAIPGMEEGSGMMKYQRSSLSDAEAERIHQQLTALMNDQAPYKNPDLTLDDLARELGVHPNHLSQVINSRESKSFYDLVNEKRVRAFIHTASQPASHQFTLLALAFECGFNSKASFNRNFKKITGQTPSEYMKLQPAT